MRHEGPWDDDDYGTEPWRLRRRRFEAQMRARFPSLAANTRAFNAVVASYSTVDRVLLATEEEMLGHRNVGEVTLRLLHRDGWKDPSRMPEIPPTEAEAVVEGLRILPRTLIDWTGLTDRERSDALGRYAEALDGLRALLERIPAE